ncbi:hypothetical protein N9E53_01275 [Amylibacter sp.]|nr:hypothetical protein [Amylibacter sp.]
MSNLIEIIAIDGCWANSSKNNSVSTFKKSANFGLGALIDPELHTFQS